MPYKRIMVAVDGSNTSEKALRESVNLAKALKVPLCVTHVADEFPVDLPLGFDLLRYQAEIKKEGLDILNTMQEIAVNQGVAAEIQLIEITDGTKKISEKILDTAQQWQADLLIIGTHGRQGIRRFLLGSVAEQVVRHSDIPILLIRGNET